MLTNLRQRVAARGESGFTLVELLVVLIIMGVLIAIAVPAYLGFKERAEKGASASNVRAAMSGAEAYYGDQSPNSYSGISVGALKAIDDIKLTNAHAETNVKPDDGYCLSSQVGGWWAGVHGPGGTITNTATDPC